MNSAIRVLIVEDCPDQAKILARLITMWGCEAATAFDGASAIALAVSFGPHLVLLDLELPDLSGFWVAEEIRERCRPLPLLAAVTGFGEPYHTLWNNAGLGDYLIKPVTSADLLTVLLKAHYQCEAREEAEARMAPQSW